MIIKSYFLKIKILIKNILNNFKNVKKLKLKKIKVKIIKIKRSKLF